MAETTTDADNQTGDDIHFLTSPYALYPLRCRLHTSDASVFRQIFLEREYSCLDDVSNPRLILDRGANVGYSAAYLLTRFPNCKLIAVEPDPNNYEMLRLNLAPFGAAVQTIRAGLWSHATQLTLEETPYRDAGAWARQVRECRAGETGGFPAVDIGTLLAEAGDDTISILKVDIEGAEAVVFSENYASWIERVENLVVELHDDSLFGPASGVFAKAIAGRGFEVNQCGELTVCKRRLKVVAAPPPESIAQDSCQPSTVPRLGISAMYRGVYLNLDRNETRRTSLVRNLEAVGAAARYERFAAVDGREVASQYNTKLDPGNLGLWLSHERVLQTHGKADLHLHIIEDDAYLSKGAAELFEVLLKNADAQFPGWDLVFTDVFVPAESSIFRLFAERMHLFAQAKALSFVDLANIVFACTSSLFINRRSIHKYASLLAGKWAVGQPIDVYIRQLVQQRLLRAYTVLPFLTTVSRESYESDIRGSMDRSRRVFEVLRRAFFIEANHQALLAEMEELTRGAKVPPLAALYLNAESFSLSDKWAPSLDG